MKTNLSPLSPVPRKPLFSYGVIVISIVLIGIALFFYGLFTFDVPDISFGISKFWLWVVVLVVIISTVYFFRKKMRSWFIRKKKDGATTVEITEAPAPVSHGFGTMLQSVLTCIVLIITAAFLIVTFFFKEKEVPVEPQPAVNYSPSLLPPPTQPVMEDSAEDIVDGLNHLKEGVSYRYNRKYKVQLAMEPVSTADAVLTFQCIDPTVPNFKSKTWNVLFPSLDIEGVHPKDCGWFTITPTNDVDVIITRTKIK